MLSASLEIHVQTRVGDPAVYPMCGLSKKHNLANAITDQNRQRVVAVGCLPNIVKLLRDDSIIPLVAPVLFNICVDYGETPITTS